MRARSIRFLGDLVFEGIETADGRLVGVEATTWRALPLPVRAMGRAHEVAQPLGLITQVWRHEDRICCAGTMRVGHGLRRALMRDCHVLAADLHISSTTQLNERTGVLALGPVEIMGATLIDGNAAPWAEMRLVLVR